MKLSEQIADCHKRRQNAVDAMGAILALAEKDERVFSHEEERQFVHHKRVVQIVDVELPGLLERQQQDAAKATPISAALIPGAPIVEYTRRQIPAAMAFTRFTLALAKARGNLSVAQEVAKAWSDTPEVEQVLKAAVAAGTTTDPAWAGSLVYQTMSDSFLELLRPATILGQIQQSMTPVPFNTKVPRQTAGATAGWIGEGAPKPVSKLSFDQVSLTPCKVAVIVVYSEELLRVSRPNVETVAQADLVQACATAIDAALIDSAAAVAGVRPAGLANGVTPIAAGGSTAAQIDAALKQALAAMLAQNIPIQGVSVLMNPVDAIGLGMIRTTSGDLVYPTVSAGTLYGMSIVRSASIAAGTLMVIAAPQILVADAGVLVDSSREASLQLDSAPANPPTPLVSLWQQDLAALRVERIINWMKRTSACFQVITGVTMLEAAAKK